MRKTTFGKLIQFFASVLVVSIVLIPGLSFSWSVQAKCGDVAQRGHLNVLTINLLFSEFENRQTRLETIADFVADHSSDPIDVILLQEVVGGSLSGTLNSGLDLKNLLASRKLYYNYSFKLANGVPGLLSVGNGVLSRCEILSTLSQILPFVIEEPFDDLKIPLRRNVMMSRINVPGFGRINVYNTHLCADCDPADRFKQAEVAMGFMKYVEKLIPGTNPMILGGDFNTDLNFSDDFPVYDLITQNGFIDTYGVSKNCTGKSCCSISTDPGCTFAADNNPYAVDPFTQQPESPERIDYIFVKGNQLSTVNSIVIFNASPDWVSDHSAVLSTIGLQ